MSQAVAMAEISPPGVAIPSTEENPAPRGRIDADGMRQLGQNLARLWTQYRADRQLIELRWLRAQRQYLGIYDPDIERMMGPNRSRAYPRITHTKVISVVSRLMNLMFPGDERNWEIQNSPSADWSNDDLREAMADAIQKDKDAGVQSQIDLDYCMSAMETYAKKHADRLADVIDDQLQELGGDQSYDYIALNREVILSAVTYGLGVMVGPYAKKSRTIHWEIDKKSGQPKPRKVEFWKPMFEFLRVWDFYPDMSAKTFREQDGYFVRKVMSRSQIVALKKREDFFGDVIDKYLRANPQGNYRPQTFEQELRAMGVKANVNEMKVETLKYEILIWKGNTSGEFLRYAGIQIADDRLTDEIDAEIWMIDANVIKADMNPWVELGVDVRMLHTFLFDTDDTSPVGQGLPSIIRDTQMGACAATRMMMDNASVICGPNLELNTDLLRPDQDLGSTSAYKIWYREGTGPEAQFPSVRNVEINGHLDELLKIVEFYQKLADQETFVGPATGGDMSNQPSEPMRTAAGASMIRGDAALPFKDIVRAFDRFTQSVILSMVRFNQKFNAHIVPDGDYDVVARGATSLVAKEVRGAQIDQMMATLKPEQMVDVDLRRMTDQQFRSRDLGDMLVSEEEANRRQQQQDASTAQSAQQAQEMQEATIRKLLSEAFKNITAANKNTATADAEQVQSALDLLERGMNGAELATGSQPGQVAATGAAQADSGPPGQPGGSDGSGLPSPAPAGDDGQPPQP